jgi:hypothetical protein
MPETRKDIHAIKRKAILDTQTLYNRVIAFYMGFFTAHLAVFDEMVRYTKKNGEPAERHWTGPELLTFAETHTLSTPSLSIDACNRRAARHIQNAHGIAPGCHQSRQR